MVSCVELIIPSEIAYSFNCGRAFQGAAINEALIIGGERMKQRLLEAAKGFLDSSGINLPFSSLDVDDDRVILRGVPNCSEMLVCALENNKIENCL